MRKILASILALLIGLTLAANPSRASSSTSTTRWLQGWPTEGHDPERTFRSPIRGPLHPHLVRSRQGYGSLIAPNGSLLGLFQVRHRSVVAELPLHGPLHVLNSSVVRLREGPAGIRPDGSVVVSGADNRRAEAFSAKGKKLWTNLSIGLSKSATPLVTGDGQFFYPAEGHPEDGSSGLYILDQQGKVMHHLLPGIPVFGVAVAPDNSVDVLIYDPASGKSFVAGFTASFQESWRQPLSTSLESFGACLCLLVAPQGTLYLGDGPVVKAFDTSGHLEWELDRPDGVEALANRPDGSIAVAGRHSLSLLSSTGELIFDLEIALRHAPGPRDIARSPSMVVDSAGTIYLSTTDGEVLVVDSQGKVVARLPAGGYHYGLTPQLLLGPPNTLVVTGNDGKVRVYR